MRNMFFIFFVFLFVGCSTEYSCNELAKRQYPGSKIESVRSTKNMIYIIDGAVYSCRLAHHGTELKTRGRPAKVK